MLVLACTVDVNPCPAASQVWVNLQTQSQDFELLGITPSAILEVFGWGFGSVILLWSIGYAVGVAISLIRRV